MAHVALVYSGLESQQSDLATLHDLAVLADPSLGSYATLGGLGHMLVADLEALRQHPAIPGDPGPSLQPRTGTLHHRGIVDRLLRRAGATTPTAPAGNAPGGATSGVLRTVEDDVAAYVTSNEHRERVRMFLREAVSRILSRPNVEGAGINGHSNGTVMGFDVIAAISPPSAPAVRALITAGSPLRPDTGAETAVPVIDIQVDNVHDSTGGGLRAHNYWDNDAFCAAAAAVISGALR